MFGFRNKNKQVRKTTIKKQPKKEEELSEEEEPLANPDDVTALSNYKITKRTKDILKENGITKLFPIQYKTFNYIYKGIDLIGRDKTGSGKTLGYALPVIERYRAEGYF
jgi:ATP-dependent RNA helicase DDX21